MVQNIDFAPTFLDLAGLEKPKYMPGTSLQPLFAYAIVHDSLVLHRVITHSKT